jgi:hypothetical protein
MVTVRPYLRAVHGVANTLRKLGRFQESLHKYQYAPTGCASVATPKQQPVTRRGCQGMRFEW